MKKKSKPTVKQEELYFIIKDFIDEHGFSPTVRQLCKLTGNKSTDTVAQKLYKLKDKGYIDFEPNKSRTIRITKRLKK